MSRDCRYINYKENEGFLFVTFEPHGCMSFRGVSYATYIDATENFECEAVLYRGDGEIYAFPSEDDLAEAVRTWLKD
jgi:hypothetical protein